MELLEPRHLLTVQEYMTLSIEARTELLGGVIYDVAPRNEPHRYAVRKLVQVLSRGLGADYIVQSQDAVALSGWQGRDAPEVDVAILRDRLYDPGPTAADAAALIEVSDTTYEADRRVKIPLYVSAGVPSYIVNVTLRHIECYVSSADLERPNGTVFGEQDTLRILGVDVPVRMLFPG